MNAKELQYNSIKFLRSNNFIKGLLLTSAAFSAIAFCTFFFNVTVGSGVALGVLLVSASDIPGNRKHHLLGMGTALFLALINFFSIHIALQYTNMVLPVLAVLVFCNAIIAVYGFRASLVSFAGLLALVLSFAHPQEGTLLYYNLFYILAGGIWYILLASVLRSYRTNKYSLELIRDCMQLTATYLKIRASLYKTKDRKVLFDRMLELQNDIITTHEDIRNAVITQRQKSGISGTKRKQLLLLIELVEILELAVSNPVDYEQYDENESKYQKVILIFSEIVDELGKRLDNMSKKNTFKRSSNEKNLEDLLKKGAEAIEIYKKDYTKLQDPKDLLTLRNLYDYIENQTRKVEVLKRILASENIENRQVLSKEEQQRFLTQQEYSFRVIIQNISLDAPIFRHSLRLVLTVCVGYLLGSIFSIQNAYWIILTIIVIMRPGYVLTKDRSKQRAIGTVIGGIIAVGIVLLTQDKIIYGVLVFISMTMAFGMIQQNYKVSAVFITLTLIFVYALLTPNALSVIEYRVLDTLIGAGLASIANYFLWPAWENQSIRQQIVTCIQSFVHYTEEVESLYNDEKTVKTSYKLARKKAFLSMSNMHAGFQRMAQEPKSRQTNITELYKVVTVSHTFLSAAASLGTYIQIHPTTKPSIHFEKNIAAIKKTLKNCEQLLESQNLTETETLLIFSKAQENLSQYYNDLKAQRNQQRKAGQTEINLEFREKLKEARVIVDQLAWMYSISQKLFNTLKTYHKS